MSPRISTIFGASFLFCSAASSQAATSMSNPLTGFTGNSQSDFPAQPSTLAGSGLNVSFVWTGGAGAWERIGFDSSGATFGGNTPVAQIDTNGRNYLRTDEVDYATVSFSAFVTIDRTARESVFFGMGTGNLGNGKAPDLGTGNASVYLDLQDGFNNASRRILGGTSGAATNIEAGFTPMDTLLGLMRLRMSYDAVAQEVTYAIDYNPSGTFTADQTFAAVDVSSIAGEWAAGENSSIYFGTQGYLMNNDPDPATRVGMTFTDFEVVVVPEPSVAFLAFGSLGLALRRRR